MVENKDIQSTLEEIEPGELYKAHISPENAFALATQCKQN